MNDNAAVTAARAAAAHVWRCRYGVEIEAAERFRNLAVELTNVGASDAVVEMARNASTDELRHAEKCRELIEHFGGKLDTPLTVGTRPVAPRVLAQQDRVLYEVVALSCVTETLSTALLGVLVERAKDRLVRNALYSILRDEVGHSRLGWAFLAEQYARGARDPVREWLPAMLSATLPNEVFSAADDASEFDRALAGFGSLERSERQRIVREALTAVIFPGLDRFGIDTRLGRSWLSERLGVQPR